MMKNLFFLSVFFLHFICVCGQSDHKYLRLIDTIEYSPAYKFTGLDTAFIEKRQHFLVTSDSIIAVVSSADFNDTSYSFSKININKKISKIARNKVEIWIAINKDRYDFLKNTRIGKLEYIPSECADGEYIGEIVNDYECISNVCSMFNLTIYCYNEKKSVIKRISFSFSLYGEFTDIFIYDINQNSYQTIYTSICICEYEMKNKSSK